MIKKIEVTWRSGAKTIEKYNPDYITAEEVFRFVSMMNNIDYAPDSEKTVSYRELD